MNSIPTLIEPKFNHKASFCDNKIISKDEASEKKNFKNVSL